ncbi:MAG: hypothetical protein WKF94_17615 [Solirubrobacteraceae bacterium]
MIIGSHVVVLFRALLVACLVVSVHAGDAAADQASDPSRPAAGLLDAGWFHTCAALETGGVRCWGSGAEGQLGNGNADTVGDDETPGSVAAMSLGAGRTAKAIATGDFHSCAVLDDASVRCWGYGGDGRLGYAAKANVRDPGAAGPVDVGGPAKAITADAAHTCALLVAGSVRCWGYGGGGELRDGRLGYGDTKNIGDDETPGSVPAVKLGEGRTATAISAGREHTCALLDDGTVKCWGRNYDNQLGYGRIISAGDSPTSSPDLLEPVDLGSGRTAKAISAGGSHSCALLDDGNVRCWGANRAGQLGYGNTERIGDDESPGSVGPVAIDAGRMVTAISAGDMHTCALLDDGSARCWGAASVGRLGYPTANGFGQQENLGDDETPAAAGPVDLGSGRTATAISAGRNHTCVRLDDAGVRCWGRGTFGRLGYCNEANVGDDEPPGAAGPVDLGERAGGAGCPASSGAPVAPGPDAAPSPEGAPSARPVTPSAPRPSTPNAAPSIAAPTRRGAAAQAARSRGLRRCLAAVARHSDGERRRARRGAARTRAETHRGRHAVSGRRRCERLFARTPGRISGLRARAVARTEVELTFKAPGTDRTQGPPVRSYLVKQSLRPIRSPGDFARAQTLCRGSCRFAVSKIGERVSLTVKDLRPRTTYYYAVAARDNVTGSLGRRSAWAKARTG